MIGKGWEREVKRRGAKHILMVDETTLSVKTLKSKSRRYFGDKKDKYAEVFFQVCAEFLELNGDYYYTGKSWVRVQPKAFGKLKYDDIDQFVSDIELIYGEAKIYGDARPLTQLFANKTNRIIIKSKHITQRIDAIFGFKNKIYKKIASKELRGFYNIFNEYIDQFKNIGAVII